MNESIHSAAFQLEDASKGARYGWDLTATEVCFPIRVDYQGKSFEVYVALTQPYDSEELIQALGKARGGYRRLAEKVQNVVGDDSSYASMCDRLFIRMEGTSSQNPAEHRKFLDQNYKLKTRSIRDGLGGIMVRPRPELVEPTPANELELLPLALDLASDVRVDLTQDLWLPADRKKVSVPMTHIFRPETEKDWRKWSRTSAEQYTKASNVWTEGVNWWARAEIYDGMIRAVEGMYLGTAPCTEANRTEWLGKIPIWHKWLALGEVFEEARVKN